MRAFLHIRFSDNRGADFNSVAFFGIYRIYDKMPVLASHVVHPVIHTKGLLLVSNRDISGFDCTWNDSQKKISQFSIQEEFKMLTKTLQTFRIEEKMRVEKMHLFVVMSISYSALIHPH